MKRGRKSNICLLLIVIGLVINTINLARLIRTRNDKEIDIAEIETTIQIEPTTGLNEELFILTEEEFKDVARLGYPEWRGECMEGQIAGFATFFNRVESLEFPDTVYEVLYQSGQFSTVWNAEIYTDTSLTEVVKYEDVPEKTIEALMRALEGEDPTEELLWKEAERLGLDPEYYAEGGALYFYNPDYCSETALEARSNIKVKVRIGNHIFYKIWDE